MAISVNRKGICGWDGISSASIKVALKTSLCSKSMIGFPNP